MQKPILIIFAALVCAACGQDISSGGFETPVESRGIEIPATFVLPAPEAGDVVPLVVMAHGHGGTRDESGAFVKVAAALAEKGIASIRVDFSGCGESTEAFTENYLTNMLADVRASREFAIQHPRIDSGRVGILGYSMGGRLAMLATEQDYYAVVALWTPVSSDGIESMIDFVGGQASYDRLKREAKSEGAAIFETPWGDVQNLNLKWFTDLEETQPLAAIQKYEGALLVVYGNRDEAIHPRYSKAAATSAVRSRPKIEHIVDGGGHGLGFYDNIPVMANSVVRTTVRFLEENL
jgi:dienelactone hydrolase